MTERRLTIGYDASVTLAPRPGGIARYTLELLRALVALPREDLQFVVLLNSLRHKPDARHEFLFNTPRVKIVRRTYPGPVVVSGWRMIQRPTWEQITGVTCDVVHGPANYIPPSRSPVVVTIHDLGFLRDDESDSSPLAGRYFRDAFPAQLPGVARIICPSQFVANEVSKMYGIAASKIAAIHSGVDSQLFSPTKKLRAEELAKYGITKLFVFAVTGNAPRKRADWIGKIAELLGPDYPQIVVVGLPTKSQDSRLTVLENVDDDLLKQLYATATLTLLTSREEGFGFPILESLASGTPVVCGRNSSTPEVGGEFADYADGDSPADFAAAIRAALQLQRPHDWQQRAIAHAQTFTWARCAEQVAATYFGASRIV